MSASSPGDLDQAVRLAVTSDTANLAKVRATVAAMSQQLGFSEADASAIALAVDEAMANVIKHGYEGHGGQPIDVTLGVLRREGRVGLEVTICDCGRHVDPATIAGRDLDDLRPGGLGTHIMRTVMDEVTYSPRYPTGMEVRLVKMLEPGPPGGPDRPQAAPEDRADA